MTANFFVARRLPALAAALLLLANPAGAAPIFTTATSAPNTPSTNTDELAFAADISNSDLLHGNIGTGGTWLGNGSSPNYLTDGLNGGDYDASGLPALVGAAWAADGNASVRTYSLGTGANGLGYDITGIQSIAGWQGAGFMNQRYNVLISTVAVPTYTLLTLVNYQPVDWVSGDAASAKGGATKVNVTDSTGILATGVVGIRFEILDTDSNNAGGVVMREIDVFGAATVASDTIPPVISTLSPANGATGVAVGANLVCTFTENIVIGTGDILIKNLDASSQAVIPVGNAQIPLSGAVLTIDPTANLDADTNYAIHIPDGAVTDLAGNPFGGISNDTTWNFTTGATPAEDFSTTQFAFTADVSAADLLHGLTPVTSGWSTTNQSSPTELTDGVHGGAYQALPTDWVQGAWTTVGATAEYHLNLGSSAAGYDITSVQSIADWVSVGFGNQAWTIEVKPVSGSYSTLATVNYQPLGAAGGGTTKVTLTHPSGVLATGVGSIRITANQVNGGANAGAFIWRELDVFGMPSNDETPPAIINTSPADNAPNASPSGNLVATFSENIVLGTGTITIKNLDVPAQSLVIALPDPLVSISGAALTVNTDNHLASGAHYAIQIDASAIKDVSGNPFAGIDNDTFWDFTTATPDLTPPAIVTLNPADNAANVTPGSNLVATFNENIALGTGTITIKNLDTPSDTIITLPDPRVSVSAHALTINPGSSLATLTDYAVRISAGAILDSSGNPFGGISNDTTWNFVTAAAPLRIMCLGDSVTAGYTDNPTWANHPFMFGYRSGLYTRLTDAGYNFLFVGASTEPWSATQNGDPTYGGTYKPAIDLRDFGQDGHRGYGGAGIWSNVNGWIDADDPDVILLMIGINGIGSGSPAALNNLVSSIVTKAPDVHLIVAQITPRSSFNQSLYNYNIYIRDTLVPNYVALGKKVSTVDLYSLFLVDPDNYASAIAPNVLANGINHPDNTRYQLMAQQWFEGIEALGLGPNTYDHWIGGFQNVGNQTAINDDPDGDGVENGVENFFGTDPGKYSGGVVAGTKSGNLFTFTHPHNPAPANDISASYLWSKDLSGFHASGATDGGGITVTLTPQPNSPSPGTTTVTAEISDPAPSNLFLKVEVSSN